MPIIETSLLGACTGLSVAVIAQCWSTSLTGAWSLRYAVGLVGLVSCAIGAVALVAG